MTSAEVTLLAKHMGHDLNIHVDHYALQLDVLERTKVAKVLTAAYIGNMSKLPELTELKEVTVKEEMVIDKGKQVTCQPTTINCPCVLIDKVRDHSSTRFDILVKRSPGIVPSVDSQYEM